MSSIQLLIGAGAWVAAVALTDPAVGAAPQPAAAPKPAAPVFDWKGPSVTGNVVSSVAYPAKDGTRRRMLLVRKEFPDDAERDTAFALRYQEARINVVFAVYDAPEATIHDARLCFHACVFHYRTSRPREDVSADLVYHADRKEMILVVLNSISVNAELRIWSFKTDAPTQKLPDVFDSANDRHWLTGAKPDFIHKTRLEDPHTCGIESIQVVTQKTGLLIVGRRQHDTCPDYVLRHDFATGKLFHVRLNDEDPDGEREKQRAEDEKALKAEEEEAMRKKAATPKTGVPK